MSGDSSTASIEEDVSRFVGKRSQPSSPRSTVTISPSKRTSPVRTPEGSEESSPDIPPVATHITPGRSVGRGITGSPLRKTPVAVSTEAEDPLKHLPVELPAEPSTKSPAKRFSTFAPVVDSGPVTPSAAMPSLRRKKVEPETRKKKSLSSSSSGEEEKKTSDIRGSPSRTISKPAPVPASPTIRVRKPIPSSTGEVPDSPIRVRKPIPSSTGEVPASPIRVRKPIPSSTGEVPARRVPPPAIGSADPRIRKPIPAATEVPASPIRVRKPIPSSTGEAPERRTGPPIRTGPQVKIGSPKPKPKTKPASSSSGSGSEEIIPAKKKQAARGKRPAKRVIDTSSSEEERRGKKPAPRTSVSEAAKDAAKKRTVVPRATSETDAKILDRIKITQSLEERPVFKELLNLIKNTSDADIPKEVEYEGDKPKRRVPK